MIYSLRIRIFLIFVVLVILAVTLAVTFTNRDTTTEFGRYVARRTMQDQFVIGEILQSPIQRGEIERAQELVEQIGDAYGRPITLADRQGQIIIASSPDIVGTAIEFRPTPAEDRPFLPDSAPGYLINHDPAFTFIIGPEQTIEIVPDVTFGAAPLPPDLLVNIPATTFNYSASEETFVGSINRSAIMAAVFAVAAAALISFSLSRRIFGPVEALTLAARQMEKGDLRQRVPVEGRDEIGSLAHAFNSMADSLAQQEQLRRNMVSDVAHELRTPLANIRGYLEGVQDGMMTADAATINSLYEEAMLLNHLIEDLQELSLAEAGQLRLNCQPIQLHEVVEQAVKSLQLRAAEQATTLTTALPDNLPKATADPERTGQILRNLLQNGLAYAAGGEVTVTAVADHNHITLHIHDNGPGIPAEQLPHIFDRFYRADESRSRATGGTGLGLAIVKALVEMQNGRIWVQSSPGQGTTFSFTLSTIW